MDFFNLSVDVFVGSRKMLLKSLGGCKQIRVTGLAISRHLGEIKAHLSQSLSLVISIRQVSLGLFLISTKNYVLLPNSSRETAIV